MARKKAGEQTNPQAAVVQDGAPLQTAGSVKEAQVPKEASQETQAQETVAGEAKTATQPAAAPAPPSTPGEASAPRLALRITAKPRKGFRRCGLHHPASPVDHPEGRFSETEIALLKAEPNLVIKDL